MAQRPSLHSRSRRRSAGESAPLTLLVLFGVAAVLTAAVLPAYKSYTLSEHGKLAMEALDDIMGYRQSWQAAHPGQRPDSLESLGYGAKAIYVSSDGTVRASASAASNSIYRLSLTAPATPSPASCGLVAEDAQTGFVLVADPVRTQQLDARCKTLCLSSSGQRGNTGSAEAEKCWGQR